MTAVDREDFAVVTADGTTIRGTRYGRVPQARALILCHGFNVHRRARRIVTLARQLAEQRAVYTFDFRGHGASEGTSTLGDREIHDLRAVIDLVRARGHGEIAVVGASMGGFVALRSAALHGGVDAVVAISAPADWNEPRLARARLLGHLVSTRAGRRLLRVLGTRVSIELGDPEPPSRIAHLISPIPVALVHGTSDPYVPVASARAIYERLGTPKRLVVLDGFGHAEAAFNPAFATSLQALLDDLVGAGHSEASEASSSGSSEVAVGSSTDTLPGPSVGSPPGAPPRSSPASSSPG